MDLQSCHEVGKTSGIARSQSSKFANLTGTDGYEPTPNSRADSLKHGRKLRPRSSLSNSFAERRPHTRKRNAPRAFYEKAADATSKTSRIIQITANTNTPMQESNADLVRLDDKLQPRLLLEVSSSERKHRSSSKNPSVSKLSAEIADRLHIDENCDASLSRAKSKSPSNKPTDGKYLRPRTSQEVIPTTACGESDAMLTTGREIFIPCQIRNALDTRIWTKKGRAVELKDAVSQELFAWELTTNSIGPSPLAFAYRTGESWYFVSAITKKRISIRRSDGDLSLLDGADSRAFFIEHDRRTSSDEGVILKSGAYEGCGITVNRDRLALSENPEEWCTWHISNRPV